MTWFLRLTLCWIVSFGGVMTFGRIVFCAVLGILLVLPLSDTCFSQEPSSGLPPTTIDWNMFGFVPSGGRYNPYETTLNAQNISSLVVAFRYVAGGIVTQPPVVANGVAYFTAADDNVYAVDAVSGSLVWKKKLAGAEFNSPAVVNGVVYIGGSNKMFALNANTGAGIWSYQTSGTVNTIPTVANGVVYFGSKDFRVYALDALTGTLLWRFKTGNYVAPAPAVDNGMVYVGSQDRYVYALNATTGALVWKYPIGSPVYNPSAVVNGVAYVGAGDLFALDATTGSLIWQGSYSSHDGGLAIANGVIYECEDGEFMAAADAATGNLIWFSSQSCVANGTPAVANGLIYEGTIDGSIYAFDTTDGSLVWSYQLGTMLGNYATAPVIVNGMVYVGAEVPKSLIAFKLP